MASHVRQVVAIVPPPDERLGVLASTGTVMLAVLPLLMGFQLLLNALILDIQETPR